MGKTMKHGRENLRTKTRQNGVQRRKTCKIFCFSMQKLSGLGGKSVLRGWFKKDYANEWEKLIGQPWHRLKSRSWQGNEGGSMSSVSTMQEGYGTALLKQIQSSKELWRTMSLPNSLQSFCKWLLKQCLNSWMERDHRGGGIKAVRALSRQTQSKIRKYGGWIKL